MSDRKEIRKLGFLGIGGGKLGVQVQAAFEQAQLSARDLNGACSVALNIVVSPPSTEDPRYGHVSYTLKVNEPPRKSMKYTTLLQDGIIVNEL
jgi:hypothetical protein